MKPNIRWLGLLIYLGAVAVQAAPQPSGAQQKMMVVVVNAHLEPAKPIQDVRVSLTYLDSARLITASQDVTNRSGQVLLLVSPDAAQSGDLQIEVTGASDLVIYQPADGQLPGLPAKITVSLLPKGSPLLLQEPAQIETMLYRLSLRVKQLEASASRERAPRKPDFSQSLREWGVAHGFSYDEVDQAVRQWAGAVQRHKAQATLRQQILAEFAQKNYDAVIQLTGEGIKAGEQELDEEQEAYLEKRRKTLLDLLSLADMQANSYQFKLQYHSATETLESTRERAEAEHRRFPEDKALHLIWLDAIWEAANAREREAEYGSASESLPLLARSIEDWRFLLHEYASPEERRDWARTQDNLGGALMDQGERSSGAQATELLAQSVQAYRAALEVPTKADLPQDWATIQDNLGDALMDQGERSSGAQATELLAQSVQAYRAALEVRTKADLPQDWATTQMNLGVALMDQGERSSGAQATELLAQAVQAHRAVLEVYTKAELPQDWARTQNNLGAALKAQGDRSSGAQATELLAQAVQADRAALEVYAKADLPQDWAKAQNNLGNALLDQGERSSGAQATELLAQAVQAYRAALEVQTKAELPQDWAMTQNNLGCALTDQGERSSGAQATELLAQAVQAYRAALEVYTKADLPQYWAVTQENLGSSLRGQGDGSSGPQATELLAQSVQAYRAALEVHTKADLPQDWAGTQYNLGLALRDQGEGSSGAQATELLAQAVQACRAALEVYTKADLPQDWAGTQNNLGDALYDQGDYSAAANAYEAVLEVYPDDIQALGAAASVYHELNRYDRAYELSERWLKLDTSSDARLTYMEAALTTAHFTECIQQAALITAGDVAPAGMLVRDSMILACQWGAGQGAAASESASALAAKAKDLQKSGWGTAGTRHFLATSPAFESGRTSWITLFQSLEDGDGAAMAVALHQLQEAMKH